MFIEPVFGKKFFGRSEVLATLEKRVTALKGGYRQNLALAGPMLTGKSSILRHFLKGIKDTDIVPVYIEMTGEDFNVFCEQFMGTLLYRYLGLSCPCGTPAKKGVESFDTLREKCRPLIPTTVSVIDSVYADLALRKKESAYERLLGLTSTFKDETGISCIVILDEFHNLANFRLKKPFKTFGKYIMVQKNTMYLVSSSQKTLLKEILSKKLSLLFGNFEVVEVNGFEDCVARSFITEKMGCAVEGCEEVCDYIIQVSQGSPFYLEIMAVKFAELSGVPGAGKTPKETLLDVFAEALYDSEGVLNQYFSNNLNFFLEKKSRRNFISILVSLADGNRTIKAIQKNLGRTDKDLGSKLKTLQDMDLVVNSGVFYTVSDKLFEYWLKYVYALKTRSMIDDMDIKYLEFKNSIEADYNRYCRFRSENITNVLAKLFESFGNEKIRVEMSDRKMPRFERVSRRSVGDNISQVSGTVHGKKWICRIKEGGMTVEQDVLDLLAVRPKGGVKVARRIFIPVSGIDQNAFLLAKDRDVWVWDIRQVNEILRLFQNFELVI